MKDLPYKIESSEIAWNCPYWQVVKDEFSVKNGAKGTYFYVDHLPCVIVVPVTKENKIAMIYQYRHPVKKWCWEVPAGGVEKGKTPEETVLSELKEEIGGTPGNIEHITSFDISNALSNIKSHVFLATNVELGKPKPEPMEILETHIKTIDEALVMAKNGEITDARTALALLSCEEKLRRLV
jgi:ADP-ribose pyrophosphatase